MGAYSNFVICLNTLNTSPIGMWIIILRLVLVEITHNWFATPSFTFQFAL